MREATPHLTIRHSHHLGCLHLRRSPLHDLVDDPQPLYLPYAHRDHVLFHPALLWNAFTLKESLVLFYQPDIITWRLQVSQFPLTLCSELNTFKLQLKLPVTNSRRCMKTPQIRKQVLST
jgi:hypothetical protein